jgi:ankyrin repeat protein
VLRSGRVVRTREAQLEHEDRLFKVLGLVGGLGFWEAWRLPLVCRELRFGFSGGGAPADMIKLGLEKRGVWAKLREARAARRDGRGETRLYRACNADVENVPRVCELIELGWPGSVEARTNWGSTPLIGVSDRGHASIVRALLAAGADVNAANNNGDTALIFACYWGRLESARLLVAAKALVNARSAVGYTPLNCSRGFKRATANPTIEAPLLAAGATA